MAADEKMTFWGSVVSKTSRRECLSASWTRMFVLYPTKTPCHTMSKSFVQTHRIMRLAPQYSRPTSMNSGSLRTLCLSSYQTQQSSTYSELEGILKVDLGLIPDDYKFVTTKRLLSTVQGVHRSRNLWLQYSNVVFV